MYGLLSAAKNLENGKQQRKGVADYKRADEKHNEKLLKRVAALVLWRTIHGILGGLGSGSETTVRVR